MNLLCSPLHLRPTFPLRVRYPLPARGAHDVVLGCPVAAIAASYEQCANLGQSRDFIVEFGEDLLNVHE